MKQQSEVDLLQRVEEALFREIGEGSSLAHEAEKQHPAEEVEGRDSGPEASSALAISENTVWAFRRSTAQDPLSGKYGRTRRDRRVLQVISPIGQTHYLVRWADGAKAEFIVPLSTLEEYVFFADEEDARRYRF